MILNHADIWVHFRKEEEALFPAFEEFLPREGGPTGQMFREHEQLREANEGLQRGLAGYLRDPGDGAAVTLVREHGRRITRLLRKHIYKEDNMLFMMADMHLDEDRNQRTLRVARFAQIEELGQ